MANLTITIDDEVLRRARIRALEQGTSVNSLLRAYLEAYANPQEHMDVRVEFARLAQQAQCGSGPGGRRWTRDDLHER